MKIEDWEWTPVVKQLQDWPLQNPRGSAVWLMCFWAGGDVSRTLTAGLAERERVDAMTLCFSMTLVYVCLTLLLWYEFNWCVSSRDRQTVCVTAHQAQVPSSHSKGQCHLPSALRLETHVSRGWYTLADVTCEEAVPIQNRNTREPPGDANHQLPFPRGIIHVWCFYLERTKGTIGVLSVAAKVIWSLNDF